MPARRRPQREHLVLTDPRALRALAHPARTATVDELYQGNVRTASELARLTGLTPSAMSYHLRTLERWGIVRRATSTGDGRARPWEASAKGLSWAGATAQDAASDIIAGLYLDRLRRDLVSSRQREPEEPPQWQGLASINRGFPWLTATETAELSRGVHDLVQRIKAGSTIDEHPDDARRVAFFFAVVPLHKDDDGSAADERG